MKPTFLTFESYDPIQVYCDLSFKSLAWTVIMKRNINNPHETWNRTWNEYKTGFGKLDDDFWLGTRYIRQIVNSNIKTLLRIEIMDENNDVKTFESESISLGDEKSNYELKEDEIYLSSKIHQKNYYEDAVLESIFSTTLFGKNSIFSTWDRPLPKFVNCTNTVNYLSGGWWFTPSTCPEWSLTSKIPKFPSIKKKIKQIELKVRKV